MPNGNSELPRIGGVEERKPRTANLDRRGRGYRDSPAFNKIEIGRGKTQGRCISRAMMGQNMRGQSVNLENVL
jgi:hypothetical protein